MEKVDEILREECKLEYVYNSYFKTKRNMLYDELDEIISTCINEKFEEQKINCSYIKTQDDLHSNQFTVYNNMFFLPYGKSFDQTLLHCQHDVFKFSFYSINKSNDISPFGSYLSHQINFVLNPQKIGVDNSDLQCAILEQIQRVLLKNYQTVILDCLCDSPFMTECTCIFDRASLCCKPYLKYFSSDSSYDVEYVPNFLEDIPIAFWTNFQPEITISCKKNEDDEVEYKKHECDKYELSSIERNYCSVNISYDGNHTSKKKVLINGRCIASISNYFDSNGEKRLIVTFYTNEIFLVCYISDLRYLWCDDDVLHADMLKRMHNEKEKNCLHSSDKGCPTLIKHPLCYRHDLCFWLDEVHREEHLLECIRLITHNLVHSVRLLKVLRHEETSCVSYCYRMIYGRLDGAMSHNDSVYLQNKLRLFLLHKGYMLR